jgi:putative addiction module component (TIGR02574 family)
MAIRVGLREELLTLSVTERRELAEELCASLEDELGERAWEEAWSSEVERRLAQVTSGAVTLVDADEVHADLRAELRHADR